jgi:hypothetical protein
MVSTIPHDKDCSHLGDMKISFARREFFSGGMPGSAGLGERSAPSQFTGGPRQSAVGRTSAVGSDRTCSPASFDASFLGQKAGEKNKRCRAPVGETFAPKQIIWPQVAKLDELGKFCCAQRPMLLAVA